MPAPLAFRVHRHPSPWATLGAVAATLAALAIAVPAAAAPYNPDRLPTNQIAAVGQICQSVIGVRPGETHFAGCVDSLSQSWRGLDRARRLAGARAGCIAHGLAPNTPELAQCVLASSSDATSPSVRPTSEPGSSAPSYFRASPREAHRREEQACARLGYDPTSGGFASCVAGLQSTMFAADNPVN